MKRIAAVVATGLSVVALFTAALGPVAAASPRSSWLVMFRDSADVNSRVNSLQGPYGSGARFRYTACDGFAADLTDNQVRLLRALPFVDMVAPDGTAQIAATAP